MTAVFQYFLTTFAPIHEFHELHQKYNELFHPAQVAQNWFEEHSGVFWQMVWLLSSPGISQIEYLWNVVAGSVRTQDL